MIIKDTNKGRGICPICGDEAVYENGDCIESEMWEQFHCNKCGIYFSDKYEVKYIGFTIRKPKWIEY